jgi:DNA-3-methyladenine glycosylase II
MRMAPRRSARLSTSSVAEKNATGDNGPVATQASKRKATVTNALEESGNDGLAVSLKPKRRRNAKSSPPSTPTPAAAKLMGLPYSSGDIDGSMPAPPLNRVADPHITNALLISPATSRVVANNTAPPESPSKLSSPHAKTTTGNILEKAYAHLIKTDPRLKHVIEKHNCVLFSPESLAEEIDPFRSLASGIISQQVGLFLFLTVCQFIYDQNTCDA